MSLPAQWRGLIGVVVVLAAAGLVEAQRGGSSPRPVPSRRPGTSGQHVTPHPAPHRALTPGRSPAFAEVRVQTRTSPTQVLKWLDHSGGKYSRLDSLLQNGLTGHEHRVLIRQSLDRLATLSHDSKESWSLARSVWRSPGPSPAPDAPEPGQFNAISARLTRQTQREGVESVFEPASRKQWTEASARAQEWVRRDADWFPRGRDKSAAHQETGQVLKAVGNLHPQAAALDQLDRALRLDGRKDLPEMVRALRQVDPELLPAQARQGVNGLRGLAELRAASAGPWKQSPRPDQLLKDLDDFEQAVGQLPVGAADPALVGRIRQDLAFKAFIEGHPAAAHALWPADGPAGPAGNLLRDMRVLITGKGEVTTHAGRPAGAGPEGPPPALPPGLRPLMPEGATQGWRPPPRGKATAGLPALEEAAQQAEPLRDAIALRVREAREELDVRLQPHFQPLRRLHLQFRSEAESEQRLLQHLRTKVGLPLRPAEVAWALDRLHQGEDPEELARKLTEDRKKEQVEEDWVRVLSYLDPARVTDELRKKVGDELRRGKEVADVVVGLAHALSPACQAAGGNVRDLVRLDEVLKELEPAPDAFEYAEVLRRVEEGGTSAEVLALVGKQRRSRRVEHDLERVRGYAERPLTEAERKKAREMLEEGKEVADVVAALPEALCPERRDVPGGVREAVLLDEINEQLPPGLSAFEHARARRLLRQGSRPADVITLIQIQRDEASDPW